MRRLLILLTISIAALAQGPLDPKLLLKSAIDSWPTYHGDYSGRHYSTLNQINRANVKALSLAWVYRANTAEAGAIMGGEAKQGDSPIWLSYLGPQSIKAIPLMVNGILYVSMPDHAWAVDARSGQEIWHYFWKTKGGIHIGNRGVGMYNNWIFFETPDCYLVSLDATTGKERWHKMIADVKQEYFCTPAPVIVREHVLVGMGGDSLDVPGWLESRDPETGDVQWNGIRRLGQASLAQKPGRMHTPWSTAAACRGNRRPTIPNLTCCTYPRAIPIRLWPPKAERVITCGRHPLWP